MPAIIRQKAVTFPPGSKWLVDRAALVLLAFQQTSYTSTFVENSKLKRLLLKTEKEIERHHAAKDKRQKSAAKAVRAVRVRCYIWCPGYRTHEPLAANCQHITDHFMIDSLTILSLLASCLTLGKRYTFCLASAG